MSRFSKGRNLMVTKVFERAGSAKDIYKVPDGAGGYECIEFLFSERVSILDLGGLPVLFPGLGKIRCAISGRIFQELNAAGFATHYISHDIEAATMRVKPLEIYELDTHYGPSNCGRVLGVEIIDRWVVTEKLLRRIAAGEVDQAAIESLLVDERGLVVGARLNPPFVECTTKYRDADVYVSDTQAAELAMIDHPQLMTCYDEVKRAAAFLKNFFHSYGFDRKDGKWEGAWFGGGFMFADSISPDEQRLIGPDGRSHDKDPVRQWFENNHPDWYKSVVAAKEQFPEDRSKWPQYPVEMPPEEVILDVVERYKTVAVGIDAM
jgi:phosphoribosylaminoimidazole-succinocarboxamide synthase